MAELGSVTGGEPALLIVVVAEPILDTWMEYVPGRVVESVEAVTTDVSEELAETLPPAAVAMPCTALCSESKVAPKLDRADCCDCSVVTSVCSSCMGSEAMETARCKTCWKELEKVLWPVNVTGLLSELAELLITNHLCNIRAEPCGPGPKVKTNQRGG